jgi:hypothetical protein
MTSPMNLEHLEPEQLWPSRRTCQLTAGLNLAQYFFCAVPLCANRREKATMQELNWFRNATFLSRLGSAPGLTQKRPHRRRISRQMRAAQTRPIRLPIFFSRRSKVRSQNNFAFGRSWRRSVTETDPRVDRQICRQLGVRPLAVVPSQGLRPMSKRSRRPTRIMPPSLHTDGEDERTAAS